MTRSRPRLPWFGFLAVLPPVAVAAVASLPAAGTAGEEPPRASAYPFAFEDVGDEAGIFPRAAGVRAHAAAWGDAHGDGYPDLFVGTFDEAGSRTSLFLRNEKGRFRLDRQELLHLSGCTSGAAFVDLTNAGPLDLYVSNNAHGEAGPKATPSALYRNNGTGRFIDVSNESGACPPGSLGRGVSAADFDGDGVLDLLAGEYYYSTRAATGTALYRNRG